MFRIAIVEDEASVRAQLEEYIHRYETEYHESFTICFFTDGDEIVSDYTASYDIIFLDIQMSRMNGMEAAKRIREMDQSVLLIFITNMSNYAIQGYSVDAMDYVLKPVPYFAFSQQLHKAVEKLKSRKITSLLIPIENGILRLKTSDIYFIETSLRHRLIVHTREGDHSVIGTLKSLEEKLDPKTFVRCNSGYLVNLEQVNRIEQNTAIVGPHQVLISRPRKKAFMESLADFIGGTLG